ncbi:MAG: hypothetical protein LBG76_08570 [Treponema sp.]|jgi:hypothetical protein|nr:hypothetical protein [Treponema sp.]
MLAFTSITVFAAPGSAAAALGNGSSAVVSAGVLDGADDLFADVQATELTTEEAQAVREEISCSSLLRLSFSWSLSLS